MISGIPECHSSIHGKHSMTDPRQDCGIADCEALFVKGLRQFVDTCAYINAARLGRNARRPLDSNDASYCSERR